MSYAELPIIPAMPDAAREMSAPQRAMAKLGLLRDIDLALHLPLRSL